MNQDQTGSRKALRIVIYTLLVTSAAATFFFSDQLWTAAREGKLPIWAPMTAPVVFTAFVMLYSFDRWLLVRRYGYPLPRAFSQLAVALGVLTLLLPQQAAEFRVSRRSAQPTDAMTTLLEHRDERVRAAACEILGATHLQGALDRVREIAETDTSERVRARCRDAVDEDRVAVEQ